MAFINTSVTSNEAQKYLTDVYKMFIKIDKESRESFQASLVVALAQKGDTQIVVTEIILKQAEHQHKWWYGYKV